MILTIAIIAFVFVLLGMRKEKIRQEAVMKCMLCGKTIDDPYSFDEFQGTFCHKCARLIYDTWWEDYFSTYT